MASYTIDIPDGQGAGVVEAFCFFNNYQATIPNPNYDPVNPGTVSPTIPNPMDANEFSRQQIIAYITRVYTDYQAYLAAQTARAQAENTLTIT